MLGSQLKKLRKAKNIKQRQLAEYLNVSTGAVGLWELDYRSPDNETLIKIAEYFDVSIEYLLGVSVANEVTVVNGNGECRKYVLTQDNLKKVQELLSSLKTDK